MVMVISALVSDYKNVVHVIGDKRLISKNFSHYPLKYGRQGLQAEWCSSENVVLSIVGECSDFLRFRSNFKLIKSFLQVNY